MIEAETVLLLLARTGAASSSQLGDWTNCARSKLHNMLGKLAAGNLIAPAAKVQLSPSGRPQTVWRLLALGARRAGMFFSAGVGREAIVKGILKTDFVLAHPNGDYPLFFADQIADFEKHGESWPWQGQDKPTRINMLIRLIENRMQVILPIATLREAQDLLKPELLTWAQRPDYTLTLLAVEEQAANIRALFNPQPNWNDPYCQQRKTYREWRGCLRGLSTNEEQYRHHIMRVLAWIEADGNQNTSERYDLIIRAFPEQPFEPEIRTLWIGSLQLLRNRRTKSNSNTDRDTEDDTEY